MYNIHTYINTIFNSRAFLTFPHPPPSPLKKKKRNPNTEYMALRD